MIRDPVTVTLSIHSDYFHRKFLSQFPVSPLSMDAQEKIIVGIKDHKRSIFLATNWIYS